MKFCSKSVKRTNRIICSPCIKMGDRLSCQNIGYMWFPASPRNQVKLCTNEILACFSWTYPWWDKVQTLLEVQVLMTVFRSQNTVKN